MVQIINEKCEYSVDYNKFNYQSNIINLVFIINEFHFKLDDIKCIYDVKKDILT